MLIGEVAEQAGISTRVLRHYDAIGLIRPGARTAGGYRDYSAGDLRRLFQVESLRSLGLSLTEVKQALDDPEFVPLTLVDELIATTRERIKREQWLLTRFEQLRASDPASWTDVLQIVALLRGLASPEPSRRQQVALMAAAETRLPAATLAVALLEEDDPNVAGALEWALARSASDGLAVLEAALDTHDVQLRRRAVAAIGKIDTEEAHAILTGMLDGEDEDLRRRAALILGKKGAVEAVPTLLSMIIRDIDDAAAADVLASLACRHRAEDDIAAMIDRELRRSDASSQQRSRLTQALVDIQGPLAHGILDALVDDADPAVRRIAAYFVHRHAQGARTSAASTPGK